MNKAQHEKWLLKQGAHPTQIKQRKKNSKKFVKTVSAPGYYDNLANTIPPHTLNNSIWEKIRTGQESSLTIAAIKDKARRVGPAFNKGALQLLSGIEEIRSAGKKYV